MPSLLSLSKYSRYRAPKNLRLRTARRSIVLFVCLAACVSCGARATLVPGPEVAWAYSAGAQTGAAAPFEVARFLEETADARGFHLQPDARLARLAQHCAARERSLSASELELRVRQLGIYDAHYAVITEAVPAHIARSGVRDSLEQALRSHDFTHYGAAWGQHAGERTLIVLLSARRVWLSPVPSSVPLHTTLHLRGRLPAGYRNLRVEVLSESRRALIPVSAQRELSVQLRAAHPGLQRIELRGEGAKGVETLAKLPVYIDQPFPSEPTPVRASSAPDVVVVAQNVFASINRERAKAGLPALERDARLDRVAHAHSRDMRDHDFLGDTSARSGDAVQRVAQAGLPTPLVLESVTRASRPSALEAGPDTPANELGNVLSRQVTHVGVGVAKHRDAYGELWIATELFVELPERLEITGAAPRLLGLLNEARVGRGAPTVGLDQGLCSVAQRAAERFVSDPNATERAILAEADKELVRFSLSYRRVNALLAQTARLQDAASLEPALDPDASGIGLGIAQGTRAGASTVAIVMILGTPR